MSNAGLLKGGVIVFVLIAALAVFDSYNGYSFSRITAYAVDDTAADCQFDLSAYPCMFGYANGNDFDGVIVIGDQASSTDVISSVDISYGLQSYFGSLPPAKLASELASPTAHKVISVGGACVNSVTAEWLGNPADCTTGLKEGTAVIKLIKHPNGQIGIVVMGYSDVALRRAARVLANYKKWQDAGKLMGNEVIVTGTGLTDDTIAVFESEESFNPNAKGSLYAGLSYTCYDGSGGGISVGSTSTECRGYDELRKIAELGCLDHCTASGTSKCGVNNLNFDPCTLPDLTVTDLSAIVEGERVKGSYLINLFDASISTPFYVVTRIIPDGGVVANITVDTMITADTIREEGLIFDRSNIECGWNTLEVTADDSNSVVEKDENNNKAQFKVMNECPPGNVSLKIGHGWNIVGVNALQSIGGSRCNRNMIGVGDGGKVWSYRSFAPRWDLYNLDSRFKPQPEAAQERLEKSDAVWLLNNGNACSMSAFLNPHTASFRIYKGWNMVAVQPNWVGKKLGDILDNCDFEAGWQFSPQTGWKTPRMSRDTVFAAEDVGTGFWVFVNDACGFKAVPAA